MTLDDIIRLAGEAGLWLDSEGSIAGGQLDSVPRFAALVAAAEREACAKACDQMRPVFRAYDHRYFDAATDCADVIRARNKI